MIVLFIVLFQRNKLSKETQRLAPPNEREENEKLGSGGDAKREEGGRAGKEKKKGMERKEREGRGGERKIKDLTKERRETGGKKKRRGERREKRAEERRARKE